MSRPSLQAAEIRIALICPTLGRSSLPALLDSIDESITEQDTFFLVADGPEAAARVDVVLGERGPVRGGFHIIALPSRIGDYGCTPCDAGMEAAIDSGCTHAFFIGDDDVLTPVAFTVVREAVTQTPGVPILFSMRHAGRVLSHDLTCTNVSGQQIVVPLDIERLPKMADFPPSELLVSDWAFIQNVDKVWGSQTVFRAEEIAILPQQNYGRIF